MHKYILILCGERNQPEMTHIIQYIQFLPGLETMHHHPVFNIKS